MRRHLPRLLLTGALLSPVTLYALGLGEIRLNSALNQPFDADIELIAPTADELASLKVGLANNDLFSRYGLDRPAFLSNFDFSVTRSRDGRATVKVTSNRSVTEPFVTLLVEANWGRGRLLREYTVLLDPPVFMPSQPSAQTPVTAPQSGARTEGRIERAPEATPTPVPTPTPAEPTRSVPEPQPARATPAPSTAVPAALGGSYTVERNDTLWRIASSAQPGASRRVINQTMIALFRANPNAFDGNINRLRAGSVLRLPEQNDIEGIPTAEAAAEVSRQQEEWSGGVRTATGDEPSRLRLVPPEETPTAPAPGPESPATATPAPAAGRATTAPTDRRLEVTSPELANVQRPTEAPVTPEPTATTPPAIETPPTAELPAEQPPVQVEQPAETPAVVPTPQPQPASAQPQAEEPSLISRIADFWWVLVVLGLLVVGALAFLKRRREQGDSDPLPDSFDALDYEPRATRAVTTRAREDAFSGDDDHTDHDATQNLDEPVVAAATRRPAADTTRVRDADTTQVKTPRSSDDTLSSESAVRFDQQDALAEADFHMAYGLYDQAADLVKIAIDREPERRDLKLKLLEIYFVWGNKELFLDTARDLSGNRAQAPAGEWDKILIMGRQIAPDDALFKGESSSGVDLVDVNLEGGENRVDVDLFAEPGDGPGLDLQFASGEHKGVDGDSDLDFLLNDEDKAAGDDEPTREMDSGARTQETPTIESPQIDRASTTIREKIDKAAFNKTGTDQTAELSLDDLGLDIDELETTGSLEDTTALTRDTRDSHTAGDTAIARPIRDDEMTQLAQSLGSLDRTMEAPRVEKFDINSTGTIYVDQVDLAGGDTVEQRRPIDVESTASLVRPTDIDLDKLAAADERDDTIRKPGGGDAARFSNDVFSEGTASFPKIDLDVGEASSNEDHEPTNKVITTEMELSELEPVTMSEVGTKLDLARAYMDMGDPDGARSILEEVAAEGTANQKQEAQRLLDSIR